MENSFNCHCNIQWKSYQNRLMRSVMQQDCADRDSVSFCLTLQICALTDLYTHLTETPAGTLDLSPLVLQSLRTCEGRLLKWMESCHWCDIFSSFKKIDEMFIKYFDEFSFVYITGIYPSFLSWTDFKGQIKEICGCTMMQSVVSDILRLSSDYLARATGRGDSLPSSVAVVCRCIHQFFAFSGRLSVKRDDLKLACQSDFLDSIDRVNGLRVEDFTRLEVPIIANWLRDFDVSDPAYFHHSGGTTAEKKRTIDDKELIMTIDKRLKYVVRSIYPDIPYQEKNIDRASRFICVPKSVAKLRGIAAEPTPLQWFQQGIKDHLYRYFDSHPYLSRRIRLSDQDANRDLAQVGSSNGRYTTIDLSSASDSVSYALVKEWFGKTPLWRWIIAGRSEWCQISDDCRIRLPMFGTMGSATTFPLECLVFTAMCDATIRCAGGDPRMSRYRVYGDDIIIESEYADALMRRLSSNGFIPNVTKTFGADATRSHQPGFRESCGGEYLLGYDVGVVRIGRRWKNVYPITFRTDPAQFSAFESLANDLFDGGCFAMRRYLIASALPTSEQLAYASFSEPGSDVGIWSISPTNYLAKKSTYRRDWIARQKGYVSRSSSMGRRRDATAYREWLRLASLRSSDPIMDPLCPMTGEPSRPRLAIGWLFDLSLHCK